MAYTKYSLTPADNNAAPPNGAPEGMLPSAVNDTMRDMMAQIRDVGDGIRGGTYTMTAPVITGGTITGVALTGNTFTSPVISGGSINNTPIGATTANTGAFSTLSATGVTTVQAGSVSAPAITTTGDTNTGIFFPAADTIAFTEGGVESMRITSAGNVGIGTSSPSSFSGFTVLEVYNATDGGMVLAKGSDVTMEMSAEDSASVGNIGTRTNHGIAFKTNTTERMRIDPNGFVLVGKTAENNTSPGITLGRQENGNAPQQKWVKTFSGTVNGLLNIHNGTYVGGIDFSNTATSFPTSSDIRLKTNVVDAGSASEKIDQIRIVSHGWKHDDSVVEFGVVAQELYAVAPQAVTKGDDGEEIKTAWGVDYSKLVPMLLKAHQEQQTIITSLTARIAALESN